MSERPAQNTRPRRMGRASSVGRTDRAAHAAVVDVATCHEAADDSGGHAAMLPHPAETGQGPRAASHITGRIPTVTAPGGRGGSTAGRTVNGAAGGRGRPGRDGRQWGSRGRDGRQWAREGVSGRKDTATSAHMSRSRAIGRSDGNPSVGTGPGMRPGSGRVADRWRTGVAAMATPAGGPGRPVAGVAERADRPRPGESASTSARKDAHPTSCPPRQPGHLRLRRCRRVRCGTLDPWAQCPKKGIRVGGRMRTRLSLNLNRRARTLDRRGWRCGPCRYFSP